jgi:hypothetical protein
MSAHPIAIIHDGTVDIPDEVKSDPRFQNGARLQLVPLPNHQQAAGGDWRRLEGLLADSGFDPNAELALEKQKELEGDTRWHRA